MTTDRQHHSGEGIFFTSRMFDEFSIFANGMYFKRFKKEGDGHDWLLQGDKNILRKGSLVHLSIPLTSPTETRKIFDEFSDIHSEGEPGFHTTQISIQLAQGDSDTYISRSQAKRVLAGAEKFKHVVLDFRGIRSVGQGFVDEVFRVFKEQQPHVQVDFINANEDVTFMIERTVPNKKPILPNY